MQHNLSNLDYLEGTMSQVSYLSSSFFSWNLENYVPKHGEKFPVFLHEIKTRT